MICKIKLTWYPLTSFGFNSVDNLSKGFKGHSEYMTTICSYLSQLRYPISSSNSQGKNLTASGTETACRCAHRVLGYAVGENHSHPLATTRSSSSGDRKIDPLMSDATGNTIKFCFPEFSISRIEIPIKKNGQTEQSRNTTLWRHRNSYSVSSL